MQSYSKELQMRSGLCLVVIVLAIVSPSFAAGEIKINFQILMLEPFSFDLVWNHNGSNANPYTTGIEGTSKLYLGDGVPEQSWLFRFVESVIRSGFFLKIPAVWIGN